MYLLKSSIHSTAPANLITPSDSQPRIIDHINLNIITTGVIYFKSYFFIKTPVALEINLPLGVW
jgi:hypothetical protein